MLYCYAYINTLSTILCYTIGMPTRIPYRDLVEALQPLLIKLPKDSINIHNIDEITFISCLIYAFNISKDLYKLGTSIYYNMCLCICVFIVYVYDKSSIMVVCSVYYIRIVFNMCHIFLYVIRTHTTLILLLFIMHPS